MRRDPDRHVYRVDRNDSAESGQVDDVPLEYFGTVGELARATPATRPSPSL
ncbi:MAG: hypothetical protein ABIP55_03100 [Tepidisphaeraceae bacterium]